jgi:hypothetical protein
VSKVQAISYFLQAMRDMPGRKSLLLFSPVMPLGDTIVGYDKSFLDQYILLTDEALRAGVVIHTFDIAGLSVEAGPSPMELLGGALLLSERTGGIGVCNQNFFLNGIGEKAEEELKGYYLLAYTPPAGTFNNRQGSGEYHRIKIKVNRSGLRVHTREGFWGTTNPPWMVRRREGTDLMQEALFSPFLHNDLKVNIGSFYAEAARFGYFLRTWLQVDPKNLTFIDEGDGGESVSLESINITYDSAGKIQDKTHARTDYYFREKNLERVKRDGISFDLFLPVKKPGAYYVRAAIMDRATGKIGSAYQFLEVPDLKKNNFLLSSILLTAREKRPSVGQIGPGEGTGEPPESVTQKQDALQSPAVRSYLPTGELEYAVFAYNARREEGKSPQLETRLVLFKDGKEFYTGEIQKVRIEAGTDLKRIPILRYLAFRNGVPPGQYVLQLLVTDTLAGKKNNLAFQAIDFEIRPH